MKFLRHSRLLPAALVAGFAAACALALVGPGAAGAAKGKRFALLVGVNKYADGKLGELKYAENDVEELAKVLSAPEAGFRRVIVLTTERGEDREADAPTAKNVRDSLKGLLNKRGPEDTVLIAFCGHGATVAGKAYLCPSDGKAGDAATLVGADELFKALGESGAGAKLLLVDAARGDPKAGLALDVEALPATPKGVAALFSCATGQRSYESEKLGKGHGVFFHHVLEGLRGKAKGEGDAVGWGRLAEYVSEKVAAEAPPAGGAAQEPYEVKRLSGRSSVVAGVQPGAAAPAAATGKEVTNSVGMKFMPIPAGKFLRGAPATEAGSADQERPQVEITISKPFHMAAHEVTQAQYEKVVGSNPSSFSAKGSNSAKVKGLDTSNFPVETVSHDDAKAFCDKLSALPEEKKAGRSYRLPTEAEWEYACRAGTATPFHYGGSLNSTEANFNGDFPYGGAAKGPNLGRPAAVGSYKPNAWGLYDMHGNLCEWTSDWKDADYYKSAPKVDPTGPATGTSKSIRGGAWSYDSAYVRSASRDSNAPSARNELNTIRVVLVSPTK